MWPIRNPDAAFRAAVRQHFGALARECGSRLVDVGAMIFGFRTEHAVLTVGAYPRHFRGICVKLRRREGGGEVRVNDERDIGLANVEEFVAGRRSAVHTKRQRWAAAEIEEEVAGLAEVTRHVDLPFLTMSAGDWEGLRAFVDEKIENAPKPWLNLKLERPAMRRFERRGGNGTTGETV